MLEELRIFTAQTSVAEWIDRWPQVIPLFLARQMSCVGCSMAAFDSVQDAAMNYQIPIDEFMLDLLGAIQPHLK